MAKRIEESPEFGKTWFIDLDGTIFRHNEYLDIKGGIQRPLPHALKFLRSIPKQDTVVFTTGRKEKYRAYTIRCLKQAKIRFDHLIMGLPRGTRIIINDEKEDGRKTAIGITVARNGRLSEHRKLSRELYRLVSSGKI
jgi:hypothetical protein